MGMIKDWLFRTALQKGVQRGTATLLAWISAQGADPAIQSALAHWGITINGDVVNVALTILFASVIEMIRNYVKFKFPSLAPLLILAVMMTCPIQGAAGENPPPSQIISTLKTPEVGASFSYWQDSWHREAVGYFTLMELGPKAGAEGTSYIDFCAGVSTERLDEGVHLFAPIMLHPANLVSPMLRIFPESFRSRLKVIELPKWLKVGPALRYNTTRPANKQRIMEDIALVISGRIG
jgi:hypothetical protein